MTPERIAALRHAHPWLPEDYLRLLATVEPDARRYGFAWFDGPRRPGVQAGADAARRFPDAWWIGRRSGQVLGYEAVASGPPRLVEWGASQQRRVARFSGVDALILAQRDPARDSRPVVAHDLRIGGMAFGAWHDAGDVLVADGILSPGLAAPALANLLDRLADGWLAIMACADGDACRSVRRSGTGFEVCDDRHGSSGQPRVLDRAAAWAALMAVAPWNGGASVHDFASLRVPHPGPRAHPVPA